VSAARPAIWLTTTVSVFTHLHNPPSMVEKKPAPSQRPHPEFTHAARQRWESIPANIRQLLLANVWCGRCLQEVTITHSGGTIERGDLVLVGQCSECQGDVARLIEGP